MKHSNFKLMQSYLNKKDFLTDDEKDSIDYFEGKGFYKSEQDKSKMPNIFDTRQSMLLKLKNPEIRDKFIDRYFDSGLNQKLIERSELNKRFKILKNNF